MHMHVYTRDRSGGHRGGCRRFFRQRWPYSPTSRMTECVWTHSCACVPRLKMSGGGGRNTQWVMYGHHLFTDDVCEFVMPKYMYMTSNWTMRFSFFLGNGLRNLWDTCIHTFCLSCSLLSRNVPNCPEYEFSTKTWNNWHSELTRNSLPSYNVYMNLHTGITWPLLNWITGNLIKTFIR